MQTLNSCYASIAMILLGAIILATGLRRRKMGLRAQNWPNTSAKINHFYITEEMRPEVYSYIPYYKPKVEYEYTVDNISYKSNTISTDKNGWTLKDINALEDAIRREYESPVAYYNPETPSDSVLLSAPSRRTVSHYCALITSGVFIIAIFTALALFAC